MDYDISVIKQDPAGGFKSFDMVHETVVFFLSRLFDFICQCLDVSRRCSGGDDKIVSQDCLVRDIDDIDVLGFLVFQDGSDFLG